MIESLTKAREELKRVDHLVYVSLKYTRTVDVLWNTMSRMVEFYDHAVDSLLKKLVEERRIEELPPSPVEKGRLVLQRYKNDLIQDNVKLYLLLRKVLRSNPSKEQEYRRHVTGTSIIDGQEIRVDIDLVTQYYGLQQEFFEYLKELMSK